MPRPLAVALLLLCTSLWGFAFIAQKTAMDTMGPLSFASIRYLLGGLVVLPLGLLEYRRKRRDHPLTARHRLEIVGLSLVFLGGSWLQQAGLATTTVTNSGFLTALYVLVVPLLAFLLSRAKPHPIVFVGVPLALVGIYWLNGGGLDRFNFGDLLVVTGALFWGGHVLMLGRVARMTGLPVFVSALQFLLAGGLALLLAVPLEAPTLAGIGAGWAEILYAGVLSTAVAFTLQAIAQQYVPPANTAIILSAESLFAALGGAVILGERLPLVGYGGATLIFIAILLVELVPALQQRRAGTAP